MDVSTPTEQEHEQTFLPNHERRLASERTPDPVLNMSRDYLHLLTRISLPEEQHVEARQLYDGIFSLLLEQPPEIRQLILTWLDTTDLLSIRATSHALHTLIHDSERAICVNVSEHISKRYKLSHLPITVTDLSAHFMAAGRYRAIHGVAEILAMRICDSMSLRPPLAQETILLSIRSQVHSKLKWRLTRSLIILQKYLNFVLKTMIENERHLASLDDEDYISLFNIFDLDQQQFLADSMSGLTESDFVDVTASWSIFKSVCKARHVPLSLRIYTFCSGTIKQVFVYDGFAPFVELLAKDATSTVQQAILKQLDDRQMRQSLLRDHACLDSIHHLTVHKEAMKTNFRSGRSSKAREAYINHQDIWDRSARALMMQKLGRFPNIMSASEWIEDIVSSVEKGSEVIMGSWNVS